MNMMTKKRPENEKMILADMTLLPQKTIWLKV